MLAWALRWPYSEAAQGVKLAKKQAQKNQFSASAAHPLAGEARTTTPWLIFSRSAQGASPGRTLSPVTSDPVCCVTLIFWGLRALGMLVMLQAQPRPWRLPAAVNIERIQPAHGSY